MVKEYDGYLELDASRVFWKIENEELNDEIVYDSMQFYKDLFEADAKTELFLLGRSGRHLCVKNTSKNRQKFVCLRSKLLKYQRMFIADMNEYYEPEPDEKVNLKLKGDG